MDLQELVRCARSCDLTLADEVVAACFTACDEQLQFYGEEPTVALPNWAAIVVAALLVPLSALFSGLSLGLMSLDPMMLKVGLYTHSATQQTGGACQLAEAS